MGDDAVPLVVIDDPLLSLCTYNAWSLCKGIDYQMVIYDAIRGKRDELG